MRILWHDISPQIDRDLQSLALDIEIAICGSSMYEDVLALACSSYQRARSDLVLPMDQYSEIYAAIHRGQVIGTMTTTRAVRGPIETEEVFPRCLFEPRRELVGYSYRLAVAPNHTVGTLQLGHLLMRACVADAIARGIRLALLTTHVDLTRYYRSMGFLQLKPGTFLHPRLGTPHIPMVYPGDPAHVGMFSDLCESIPNPVAATSLSELIDMTASCPERPRMGGA